MQQTDVIIVGAGPIGLELAVALKHAGVDYLHVDAGQIGQTVMGYPRQARFFSSPERIAIAGVPLVSADQSKATREQYLAYLRAVVEQFDLRVRTFERVVDLKANADGFELQMQPAAPAWSRERSMAPSGSDSTPRHIHARRVVLAVGDMHRPRRLNIPGEDAPHASHYFDEPHRYFRQRLLIVGGRNSAVEAALRCHRAGAHVAITYRQAQFDTSSIKYWLLPELKSLIKHDEIAFHPRTVPVRIDPGRVQLAPVAAPGEAPAGLVRDVTADFVLLLTGYEMVPTLFEMAGVTLDGPNRSPKVDPRTMQSNVPGLYVAGTAVAGTQNRFRLFIENCHPHVARIVESITGSPPPTALVNQAARTFALPES